VGFTVAAMTPLVAAALPVAAASLHEPARPSQGCAQQSVAIGEETLDYSADADNGSYTRQVPTTAAPGKPLPVIFDLHAYQEPGQLQVTFSGLGAYGQSRGFVTITPWINGRPVPYWLSTVTSKDMAWFGDLMTHVEATTCIDENRVFVTGYSNGAFMASAAACRYSSRLAAVAPVAGIQAVLPCKTARPVPVVAFHGTADPLVHYDGTASKEADDLVAPSGTGTITAQETEIFGVTGVFRKGPSVPRQTAAWAKRNGCSDELPTKRIARDVELLSWSCPKEANVELFRVKGGGHTWPGSAESAATSKFLGRTTFSISADVEMWKFFEAHPLTRSD